MRVGLLYERKDDFPFLDGDPDDINGELLSIAEEDELVSGLRDAGHEVSLIRGTGPLLNRVQHWRKNCDLVLNRSSGFRGIEKSLIAPALLEAAGIPYVGSTPYVHALVRNKLHTKLVVKDAGVLTPDAVLLDPLLPSPDMNRIGFPAIVKLIAESSSIGLSQASIVHDAIEAKRRADELLQRYKAPVLVETFVPGFEIEVPVIEEAGVVRALGVVALTKDGALINEAAFLDSECVKSDRYGFDAPPEAVDQETVRAVAERAASILQLRDYGRVDFRVDSSGKPWLIEADTIPHIQRHSSFFAAAQQRGFAYHEMLAELLRPAVSRMREGNR